MNCGFKVRQEFLALLRSIKAQIQLEFYDDGKHKKDVKSNFYRVGEEVRTHSQRLKLFLYVPFYDSKIK